MKTKLTLNIEKSVIERAKTYAKSTGSSLSVLIQSHLEIITQDDGDLKISPKLKKIVGAVKLPKYFDSKKEIRIYFERKH